MFSSGLAMLVLFTSFKHMAITGSTPQNQHTITGIVTDASNLPLPAALVSVKGHTTSTQTDMEGKYIIKAKKGDFLVFSFIGMKTRTVKVGNATTINVRLYDDVALLENVVVTSKPVGSTKKPGHYAPASDAIREQAAGITVAKARKNILIRGYGKHESDTDSYKTANYSFPTNATEEYGTLAENPFEAPKNAPLSTFSIDVDNASYTNIRRLINNGQAVPRDAVRVEEMVNFFKYDYPQPKDQHPFSIHTEYSRAPWNPDHQLLRIGLQGKNLPPDDLPASNLVFLIDVSGSMASESKLPLLKQSLKILTQQLRRQDKVSIVVYAGAAGLVLPTTSGEDKQAISDALGRLHAGGSTAGGAGIELAYKTAQENFIHHGNNRVILATDGDFNVGASSNEAMEKLIEAKRQSGVFLTVLGYGMGNYKDSKMELLAGKGNGNYAYIDNIQEANRFLGKEFKGSMFAIAKDVKIQVEFNPNQVQAYRLIGYENRKLRPEDFTNDHIDAGELGSGHTVTALYEIIPVGVKSPFAEPTPALKYSKTQTASTRYKNELATVKFRYKQPIGDQSTEMTQIIGNEALRPEKASADFKFGAAVAWFGLRLRDSKLITNMSSADIMHLARQGLSGDKDGYRAEFIRLVDGHVKMIAGLD